MTATARAGLPPRLTREDFDSDAEFAEYLEVEGGEWVEDDASAERAAFLRRVGEATLSPPRTRISIAIPDRTLAQLKARALAEGLPYQTLVNSILHKWLEGR